MQIGVDSFVSTSKRGAVGDTQRVQDLLEEIELAEQVGLAAFGVGEHHRPDFVSSAPAVLLAAAAARTQRIRLSSAVTVLSSDDPVRVFQQFATLDLVSQGRAELMVGRGSFIESYPLFGYDLNDYNTLAAEKLELLLKIRDSEHVTWSGQHRAPLNGQGVYPRPVQQPLPIYVGVGGSPESVVRAAKLGLPLAIAIIGGSPRQFRPLADLYRQTWAEAGRSPENCTIAIHNLGFLADTTEQALDTFWPAYREVFGGIGRERGWAPPSRPQFDAQCGSLGALQVGSPEAVAEKLANEYEWLGGISRVNLLLDNRVLTHAQIMRSIELLGTKVAPLLRDL